MTYWSLVEYEQINLWWDLTLGHWTTNKRNIKQLSYITELFSEIILGVIEIPIHVLETISPISLCILLQMKTLTVLALALLLLNGGSAYDESDEENSEEERGYPDRSYENRKLDTPNPKAQDDVKTKVAEEAISSPPVIQRKSPNVYEEPMVSDAPVTQVPSMVVDQPVGTALPGHQEKKCTTNDCSGDLPKFVIKKEVRVTNNADTSFGANLAGNEMYHPDRNKPPVFVNKAKSFDVNFTPNTVLIPPRKKTTVHNGIHEPKPSTKSFSITPRISTTVPVTIRQPPRVQTQPVRTRPTPTPRPDISYVQPRQPTLRPFRPQPSRVNPSIRTRAPRPVYHPLIETPTTFEFEPQVVTRVEPNQRPSLIPQFASPNNRRFQEVNPPVRPPTSYLDVPSVNRLVPQPNLWDSNRMNFNPNPQGFDRPSYNQRFPSAQNAFAGPMQDRNLLNRFSSGFLNAYNN